MEKKGLCISCAQVEACIFKKDPPVWFCEEFFQENHLVASFKQKEIKKVFSREAATESE